MGQTSSSKEASDNESPYKQKITENDKRFINNKAELPPCPESKPILTEKHREIIKTTWKYVHDDVQKVGIVTFIGLFETHPEVRESFMSFGEVNSDDLYVNAQLRAHALRVMTTVEKVLARIDSDEKLDKLLTELGERHSQYRSKAVHMQYFGPQFIRAVKPTLEAHWSPEVEEAWRILFDYISFTMRTAMFDT